MFSSSFRALLAVVFVAACGGGSSSKPAETTPPPEPVAETPPVETPPAETPPAETGPSEEEKAAMAAKEAEMQAMKAVDEQVAMGKTLYAEKCAVCHGDNGEGGGKNPPVVGANALPKDPPKGAKKRKGVQFNTAADVFEWTKKNMPLKKPGSLTDDEYAAILAFDLKANGIEVKQKLDASNAASIQLRQ